MQRASRLAIMLGAALVASGAGISIARAKATGAAALPIPTSLTGTTTLPILAANNEGAGNGLYGYSLGGVGIVGKTKFAGINGSLTTAGTYGLDLSTSGYTNNGVLGVTGNGGFGVRGTSSDSAEGGVGGFATTGVGLDGYSASGYGAAVYGGLQGANISSGSGTGAAISSTTSYGAVITSALGGWDAIGAAQLVSVPAELVAAAGSGYAIGINSETRSATPTEQFPLVSHGFDQNNNETGVFYTDGAGDIAYSGSVVSAIHTPAGSDVTAYAAKTTESTVEDTGTSLLVAGTAIVRLDPSYAQSIDMRRPYRVFLTPDGDTRGLYVAQKTAIAFLVRETQGGRGTFSFDYRVVGSATGHLADRMTVITPALRARLFPFSVRRATTRSTPHRSTRFADTLKADDPFHRAALK